MEKLKFFRDTLQALQEKNRFRELKVVEGKNAERVVIQGREVLNLSSNNYLGLASHPRLQEAAKEAITKFGNSATASRLIVGSMELHRLLEERIAAFKETEGALLFSTGYMANVGTIAALVGRGDIVFSDRLNHASIVDGILLSQAEWKRYPHRDVERLRKLLEKHQGYRRKLIVTDSVFSMDGDIAPLPEIAELAREHNCLLFVDEAHATGVLGERGRGAVEHFHLEGKIDIQMGTLSKALGGFGAFIAGPQEIIAYLINKSRAFIYTTAPPPAVVAAGLAALELIDEEPGRREKLWENVRFFRGRLQDLGFRTGDSQTQIIPILIGDSRRTMSCSRKLFQAGVYIPGIRPPTVPPGEERLRVSLMATHTRSDLEKALEALEKTGKELGII